MIILIERRDTLKQIQNKKWLISFCKAMICFLLFWFSTYLQLLPIWLFHITKITDSLKIYLTLFSNVILVILLVLLYWKDLKKEAIHFIKNRSSCFDIGLKYWTVGLFIMMGSNLIINLFSSQHVAGNEQAVQSMITALPFGMLICAGILAPISEEITFRKAFRTFLPNKWVFAILSGLVFGGLHVVGNISNFIDVFYIVPYGALGTCFALAYEESDTVFTSITFHIIHNTILTLLSIL